MFGKIDNAEATAKKARIIVRNSKEKIELKSEETNKLLNALGKMKVKIIEKDIATLLENISKIKDIEAEKIEIKSDFLTKESIQDFLNKIKVIESDLRQIRNSKEETEIYKYCAVGGVIGTSLSRGVGIGTIVGLDIFGALGVGMIGSTLLVGVAPLVAGFILNKKANILVENAYSSLEEAYAVESKIHNSILELEIIDELVKQMFLLLKKLSDISTPYKESISNIVSKKNNWKELDESERGQIFAYFKLGQLMKEIIMLPIFESEGKLNKDAVKRVEDLKSIELK